MIVPTNRLLFSYGLTLPPLTLLPVLSGAAVMPAIVAGLMLILIALLDAAVAPLRLRDIGVSLPPMVRMTRDRESSLEVSLTNTDPRARTLRLGFPFPREISSPQEDLPAFLPKSAESSRLPWPCTPLQRGQFHIDRCLFRSKIPLGALGLPGFQGGYLRHPGIPQPGPGKEEPGRLFLNRGGYGIHARHQHGKGREFEQLREYIPGDGFDEIHWKATAKRRHPITKIFQIERTQEVYVVIDASRLSGRPLGGKVNPGAGDPPHTDELLPGAIYCGRPGSGPGSTETGRSIRRAHLQ